MAEFMQIHQKIYVILANEMQEDEGFFTLKWLLNKWGFNNNNNNNNKNPISIILLYIFSFNSNDIVITPFGKLPAKSVSDEMLLSLRKCEQDKVDKLLSKYVAFCGKFPVEIHKIEKHDELIENTVVELIIDHRITKLVMGVSFMRSSSGRSKSGINGSFYVNRNKPDFCELYVVCRGELMILKEEKDEEGYMEDEQGVLVEKVRPKPGFRGWLGKMLSSDKTPIYPSTLSSKTSSDPTSPRNNWERFEQEIEEYYKELLASTSKPSSEEEKQNEEETGPGKNSPLEQDMPSSFQDDDDDDDDKVEALRKEIQAMHNMVELNKTEAKVEVDRQAKASWTISLCSRRAEELEACLNEEISIRNELTKELDGTKEQLREIVIDVQESKNRMSSLVEQQSELSAKLQVASLAKVKGEAQLQSAASARVDIVREIEELRKQRDVFQRRIEFCKEKDAIGMANRMYDDQVSCSYREFSADEIGLATDNLAAHRRLKSCGDWTNVYKGRIKCNSVAIKMLDSDDDLSVDILKDKVDFLGNIRHPYIVASIGFSLEPKCLIFEFMHNGCLRDILFQRRKGKTLQWHRRIQIAAQVSSGLAFLHLAKPSPIVHNELNPSNVFLDRNFVGKILPLELKPSSDEVDLQADVGSFGVFLLQLLTGRNWAGLGQVSMTIDEKAILEALDDNAGDWPLGLAEEVVGLAMKCRSASLEPNAGTIMSSVAEELNHLKVVADDLIAREEFQTGNEDSFRSGEESSCVPNIIICPILQVVMENPHIAADGYSYEFEAINELLRMGHDTSPVTHSKLAHKHLTPNLSLRYLIQDWHDNKSRLSL